jgi:predicted  nucleic acid-binding Zn-ribbon protein
MNAELVSQVNRLMAEKQILKEAVKSLEEESKANDKRFSDLEDVIFFLQDEIGKVQESVSKPRSAAKPSTAAGPRAGGAKALPAAPPRKKN